MAEQREWTITIPAPYEWLTSNIERFHYRRATAVRKWRTATLIACRQARLPLGITPVRITAVAKYAGRRLPVRDRLNLEPTIKAIVDGLTPPKTFRRGRSWVHLVGYGFLPDDSDKHVLSTDWQLERIDPAWRPLLGQNTWGEVELTLRQEVPDGI